MPPVKPPAKALVTGANGYLAVWVVRQLLEEGLAVRGTVRSMAKGKYLNTMFAEYGDRFELVEVEDITAEGAFDKAVEGVELVQHTASPFNWDFKSPDELIVPAVQGTIRTLESIKNHGAAVKRVVITSSAVAVYRRSDKPEVWTESDWNDPSVEAVKSGDASPAMVYPASKTLAEKAAWEFYEKNKNNVGWDIVTINPPYIWGPPIHEVSKASSLNASLADLYAAVVTGSMDKERLTTTGNGYVDVRDAACAHVLAGTAEKAGGERILVSAAGLFWQNALDAANALIPSPVPDLPKGYPDAIKGKKPPHNYVTRKSEELLGLMYRPLEVTIRDTLVDFKARGWC
ncbi:D-lactaldehyde dehydrogenase [Amylostereum chailletii]|nr:D-lactaldehyde dehydrogenase [Amylostereum chailletii]